MIGLFPKTPLINSELQVRCPFKIKIGLIFFILWGMVLSLAFPGYCQENNQGLAEKFIKTGRSYTGHIEPLQLLAQRTVNAEEDFLYYFKIRYGDGREENRYPVLKLKNKEVIEALLFYGYEVDYMLNEFHAGKLLNSDCPSCYKSFSLLVCGGLEGIRCPDGYGCEIKPCEETDCIGVCKPIKKPQPEKSIPQPRITPANAVVSTSSVLVDRLAHRVEFSLAWMDNRFSKNDFWFSLHSPSGKVIDENTTDPQVEVINTGIAPAKGYRISEPEAGAWEVIVKHPWDIKYTTGHIIWSDLDMDWKFVNPTPKLNEPIIIEAKISEPEPVTTATVTALLRKYRLRSTECQEFNLVLLDNGTGNDRMAGDGIYTATFSQTETEGSYCVDVTAKGTTAKAGPFERNFSMCTAASNRNPLIERPSEEELERRRKEERGF